MKYIIKILTLIIFSITICSCRAQIVQTPADAKKLETNKQQFIGRPLRVLLKEITPEIKMASISPQEEADLTHFYFSFIPRRRYVILQDEHTPAVTIRVSVSGIAITGQDYRERRMAGFPWSREDAKRFGDYIIKDIGFFGDVQNQ